MKIPKISTRDFKIIYKIKGYRVPQSLYEASLSVLLEDYSRTRRIFKPGVWRWDDWANEVKMYTTFDFLDLLSELIKRKTVLEDEKAIGIKASNEKG